MKRKGMATIEFENPPVICNHACVVGPKEGEGPLGKHFDLVQADPMMGKKTWEEAESALQAAAVSKVLEKALVGASDIDYFLPGIFSGRVLPAALV